MSIESSLPAYQTLEDVAAEIRDCSRCQLHQDRMNPVPGTGDPLAPIVFIGEGPGANEDAQGLPFVGRAGKLLTEMLAEIGFSREQVFITNLVKCRPPKNRNPLPQEIRACEPYLHAQLSILKPKIICVLGTFATSTLLQSREPISRLRGHWFSYHGVKVLPVFHPAYLLRSPSKKIEFRDDFQKLLRMYHSLA